MEERRPKKLVKSCLSPRRPMYGRMDWRLATIFAKGKPYDRMVPWRSDHLPYEVPKVRSFDMRKPYMITWNPILRCPNSTRCQIFQRVTIGFNKTLETMIPSIHDHTKRGTRDYTIACLEKAPYTIMKKEWRQKLSINGKCANAKWWRKTTYGRILWKMAKQCQRMEPQRSHG